MPLLPLKERFWMVVKYFLLKSLHVFWFVRRFMLTDFILDQNEGWELKNLNELSLCIVEVCLRFLSFRLDWKNVIKNCGFQAIVNSSKVSFGSFVHGQDLPIASSILRDTSQACASVEAWSLSVLQLDELLSNATRLFDLIALFQEDFL